jgi:hypothetical protein
MNSSQKTHRRMMARVALLIGICLTTTGSQYSCSANSGGFFDGSTDTDFDSTLTLRDVSGVVTASFVFGEPIRFDFEIVNRANRQVRVSFPDGQTHEFLVLMPGTAELRWRWSDGQAFTQAATELVFEPYASKTFTLIWPGTLADGTQLPVGNYHARGALVFDGLDENPLASSDMASSLVAFSVH